MSREYKIYVLKHVKLKNIVYFKNVRQIARFLSKGDKAEEDKIHTRIHKSISAKGDYVRDDVSIELETFITEERLERLRELL